MELKEKNLAWLFAFNWYQMFGSKDRNKYYSERGERRFFIHHSFLMLLRCSWDAVYAFVQYGWGGKSESYVEKKCKDIDDLNWQ